MHAAATIRAPGDAVWRALAEPAAWAGDEGRAELRPGGAWAASGPACPAHALGGVDARVVEVDPGRRLVLDWQGPLAIDVVAAGEGTRVRVTHEGAPPGVDVTWADVWTVLLAFLQRTTEGGARDGLDLSARRRGRVTHALEVRAPVEAVFDVLTRERHVARWLSGREGAIDLRPGGAFDSGWRVDGAQVGPQQVLEVEPPRRLVVSWSFPGDPGPSRLELALSASDGGTRVALEHGPFPAAWDEVGYVLGWACCLVNARRLAEQGERAVDLA